MNTKHLETLNYVPDNDPISVSDILSTMKNREHTFIIGLDFRSYSKLARIRNHMDGNDVDALASVIERGLIELEGETKNADS